MSDQVALTGEQPTEPVKTENPTETYGVILKNPLTDFFQVGEETPDVKQKLGKIWAWAQEQSPNKDKDSVLFEVIKLKNRLGEASIGEMPWSRLLNYISIANRIKEDEKKLEELRK